MTEILDSKTFPSLSRKGHRRGPGPGETGYDPIRVPATIKSRSAVIRAAIVQIQIVLFVDEAGRSGEKGLKAVALQLFLPVGGKVAMISSFRLVNAPSCPGRA